jgi:hypothetical protein
MFTLVKPFLITLLLTALFAAGGQTKAGKGITNTQWDALYESLDSEDWVKAADLTNNYLTQLKNEPESNSKARLRYILIFTSAAKVAEDKMPYDNLEKTLTELTGKDIELPGVRFAGKCPASLGSFCIPASGNFDLSGAATNKKGTYIFAFQYVKLKEKVSADRNGQVGVVHGRFKSFELNPNRSHIWITRIVIEDGRVTFGQPIE